MTATRPELHRDDLADLGAAYAWGTPQSTRFLAAGVMNHNWQIITDRGTYAVKRLLDVDADTARRDLHTVAAVAATGFPTCAALRTRAGDLICQLGNRAYLALPWVDGRHPHGCALTTDQVSQFGVLVAHLHDVLNRVGPAAGLGPAVPPRPAPAATVAEALATVDRFRALAAAGRTPFDAAAVTALDLRRHLIIGHAASRPTQPGIPGPFGWTHGDLQHRNILWRDSVVAAVLDWDRIRVRALLEELIRTATITFVTADGILDLDRITAFMTGYRTHTPLPAATIAAAVHRYWWHRLTDFWILAFHYDRTDSSCDDLFHVTDAMIGWWTAHRTAVTTAFTATCTPVSATGAAAEQSLRSTGTAPAGRPARADH